MGKWGFHEGEMTTKKDVWVTKTMMTERLAQHACNPYTQEAEQLDQKFKASLSCIGDWMPVSRAGTHHQC